MAVRRQARESGTRRHAALLFRIFPFVIRNGSFSSSHVNIKGMTGIGENGRQYTQKGSAAQNLNTENGTQIFHIKMTGPDGCSFTYRLVIQIHTNANGDITAEKVSESIPCE